MEFQTKRFYQEPIEVGDIIQGHGDEDGYLIVTEASGSDCISSAEHGEVWGQTEYPYRLVKLDTGKEMDAVSRLEAITQFYRLVAKNDEVTMSW